MPMISAAMTISGKRGELPKKVSFPISSRMKELWALSSFRMPGDHRLWPSAVISAVYRW